MKPKIIVDSFPEHLSQCLFSVLINWTGKYTCKLRNGTYSRCFLELGKECPYLKKGEINND